MTKERPCKFPESKRIQVVWIIDCEYLLMEWRYFKLLSGIVYKKVRPASDFYYQAETSVLILVRFNTFKTIG